MKKVVLLIFLFISCSKNDVKIVADSNFNDNEKVFLVQYLENRPILKDSTLIKPTKGKTDPTFSSSQAGEKKTRGQSKWTAFQKWCKIFGVIHGYKMTRAITKAIWDSEGKDWQELWQLVADQIDKGIDTGSIIDVIKFKIKVRAGDIKLPLNNVASFWIFLNNSGVVILFKVLIGL